jgi:hypothetical protein
MALTIKPWQYHYCLHLYSFASRESALLVSPVGGPHSLGEIRGAAVVGKASAAARKKSRKRHRRLLSVRGRAGAEALSFPSPMQ